MIEISAKLTRGPVYFTNEVFKCLITFKNVVSSHRNQRLDTQEHQHEERQDEESRSNSDEILAWSGVQIHCHCTLDESKVIFNPDTDAMKQQEQMAISSRDTSFHPCQGERGHVVFSTKPKILFCDLKLAPNESKTFVYQETIPPNAPPSYNGSAVKYLYKLTIGTQRVNAVIQLLKMPIRVLSIMNSKNEFAISSESHNQEEFPDITGHVGEIVTPSNPFLQLERKETILDLALHQLDCLTARRCPSNYVITNQLGKVVKFCLLKSTFKLGEDIVGTFNFTEATVPCMQFSVTLQSEEEISKESRTKQVKPTHTHVTSYGKFHEVCLHTNHTQMILPLPLTITPGFQTNIVSLSWRLHFEFVTTKTDDMNSGTTVIDPQGVMKQSASSVNVQTMVWDLPITVYPTHPIQVARGFQIAASSILTV